MTCQKESCDGMEAGTPATSWGYVRRRGLHDQSCETAENKCSKAGCEASYRVMRGYR